MNQQTALKIMQSGENVFLTGEAGSGKTFVLNMFIEWAKDQGSSVAICASTGIAATHLGGKTIHSWSGLGISRQLDDYKLRRILANKNTTTAIEECETLIIDEISMLDGSRLDSINQILKAVKQSDLPFGGVQIIVSGDFFQLPPITNDREKDYAFNSSSWKEANFKICYLLEQHRQDDNTLLDILQAIRSNNLNEYHIEHVQSRVIEPSDSSNNITKLYTHNVDVDIINMNRLEEIPGESREFIMQTRGDKRAIANLIKGCLAPEILTIKIGAEIMFVSNHFAGKYVNGTRGKLIDFDDGRPVVKVGSKSITVEPATWKQEDKDQPLAEITQYPIRLAWAITVHKSQGMSLDSAEIDLSKAFEPGMGYVALSRVRSLKGLKLLGINNIALRVDEEVKKIDQELRSQSIDLASKFS